MGGAGSVRNSRYSAASRTFPKQICALMSSDPTAAARSGSSLWRRRAWPRWWERASAIICPTFGRRCASHREDGAIHYRSRRHWPHDSSAIDRYRRRNPANLTNPDELTERDHFLTARFRLYTTSRRRLRHATDRASAVAAGARQQSCELRETLFEAAGLPPPQGAPLVHYSAELAVKIGRLI